MSGLLYAISCIRIRLRIGHFSETYSHLRTLTCEHIFWVPISLMFKVPSSEMYQQVFAAES